MYMSYNRYKGNREGGVALRVIICVVSLAALATAIVVLLKTFEADKADDYRKAVLISEYGLQEVLVKQLYKEPGWGGFTGEPYGEDGTYSVSVAREGRGDTLYVKIVSTGAVGSITQAKECTLRLEVSGEDSVWVNEGIR
jgi:hypothetical protein